jgi:thiol:disulfide interchange protein
MRKLNYPILIALAFAIAFFCLAYPIYVIRPFRHQGPHELAAALAVIQIRPVVTVLASLAAALFLWLYWRSQPRRNGRIGAAAAVLAVWVCAVLSHVNVYERMFHPMGLPSFEAAQATRLDGKEMVIAVNVGGVARAYPIRILSYHHIANDTVGGVPIVATY